MYVFNSRKKINFSFLTILFVLFVAFPIAFGAIITSTNLEKDKQRQGNISSLQAVQDKFPFRLKEREASFLAKDLTDVFTLQTTKPLLDNLLTPGALDPTFGNGGKVITPISTNGNDYGRAVAVQLDGKIVLAGHANNGSNDDFAVARYNMDGSLDSTFGSGGKVINSVGNGNDYAFAVAVQSDGRIVVAGYSYNGANDDFSLVRYNSNGTPDTSFGFGGKIITPIGNSQDQAYDMVLQPDGKIVVAGFTANSSIDLAAVRYNINGSLDPTFGNSGKVVTPVGDGDEFAFAAAVQSDGKIILAGHSYNGSNFDALLVRYNTNGTLDTSFGGSGRILVPIGAQDDYLTAVALQSDGKIIAAGFFANNVASDFALIRVNSDGTLDTSFDGDGKVITPIGSSNDDAFAVTVQTDGKIVAAGTSSGDFAIARYNPNGSLDTSFDNDGKVTFAIGNNEDSIHAIALQTDGKIIVAGTANNGSDDDFALARLSGNDPSQAIQLQLLVGDLTSPDFVANARDNRLFIVEQPGRIKVFQNGGLVQTPFLDITQLTSYINGNVRGLLGLTFHPQYPSVPYFFVHFTSNGTPLPDGTTPANGDTVIARYSVSANPNQANFNSEKTLLVIPQPSEDHQGGMIEFGSDGYLYIAKGDGGYDQDPGTRSQDINFLNGKILRIDVNQNVNVAPYYGIPSTNPFAGSIPGADEVFLLGLRNPWRFSFDRATGDLWIGDNGRSVREEIDRLPIAAGTAGGSNLGWRVYEGTLCTNLDPCVLPANNVFPIAEYEHTNGRCSIIGGYIYHGSQIPSLQGSYIYADFCTGEIFRLQGTTQTVLLNTNIPYSITSFGEDANGELYITTGSGSVFRMTSMTPPTPTPTPTPTPVATPTPTPTPTPIPTPTPTPMPCTPFTTVSEGNLFPGGIVSFGVSSGLNSVTIDHVNAGTGLQQLTVVGVPVNAVVNIPAYTPGTYVPVTITFTRTNPGLAVDFTLRAASTFHAANIRVRCLQ